MTYAGNYRKLLTKVELTPPLNVRATARRTWVEQQGKIDKEKLEGK